MSARLAPAQHNRQRVGVIGGRIGGKSKLTATRRDRELSGMLGVPERTRTSDLRLRRPALYPLSYGHMKVRNDAGLHQSCTLFVTLQAGDAKPVGRRRSRTVPSAGLRQAQHITQCILAQPAPG
jgi:hypothetical protein